MGILEENGVTLLWFDSMGAKSSSIAIETSRGLIVVDPGAAAMQPSYPLPSIVKREFRRKALKKIASFVEKAVAVFITHYHYDHHFLPSEPEVGDPSIYYGKLLVLKNPNKYINESQWCRSRKFLEQLLELRGKKLSEYLVDPVETEFYDPVEFLEKALTRDYGDYMGRRMELLEKGRRWFRKLVGLWSSSEWVREIDLGDTRIEWGDGRRYEFGDTIVEVLDPWFHGIEYDRTGWVTPLYIRRGNLRIFYTSDLMGPVIEDYAEYIARLKPDIVVLDGPPTYLFPYMFNRINLRRAVENALTIISCRPELIIYDHHLLREGRWRERVREVFIEASRNDVELLTAAEYYGEKPLIDMIVGN